MASGGTGDKWRNLAILRRRVGEEPSGVLELFWWKARRAWYGTDVQRPIEKWILLIQSVYLLLAAAGTVLIWRTGRRGREWIILAGFVVIYFWAMTTIALSILRYMTPVMGLLFPSVAVALLAVVRSVTSRMSHIARLRRIS